ncbi:MAG: exopolyphosphatase [Acidobacteria bacterium]|nr:exopolyphosphatase [Acidobacteriota bacterium]
MTDAVAALDCGSNSTRLLVATAPGRTVCREMRITRLSQGVDASQTLVPEALDRTYATLGEFRSVMDVHGVERGLLVATSAVRDAKNGEQFINKAREIVGVDARILSGAEEANFSYAGATADLTLDERPVLVLDIGGGSTELAVVIDGVMRSYSMQLGCVRVTERALGIGVVDRDADARTRDMVRGELDKAWHAVPEFATLTGRVRLIGLAGTVATLAQMDAGIVDYDRDVVHHRVLSRLSVRHWRDVLAAQTPAQRLTQPGMVAGREDVLPAGLYVLDAVMERLGVEELLSSENDILDGIALSLFGA